MSTTSIKGAKTKVMIVDDSALMRKLLTELLSSDPALEVVGAACEPFQAREMIKRLAKCDGAVRKARKTRPS